jgi:hypothetical protein
MSSLVQFTTALTKKAETKEYELKKGEVKLVDTESPGVQELFDSP